MLIDFFRKYKILCMVFAVMLLLVAVTAVLIVREMRRQDMTADELIDALGSEAETETETITDDGETETEAVTEAAVPYYTEETDIQYLPLPHTGEAFGTVLSYDKDHRIYAAMPDTDSVGFNNYCRTTVFSLGTAVKSEENAREGGSTVVSIDYVLYVTENVYSAVFFRTETDCTDGSTEMCHIVLIYDIENTCVYAPLDAYDMTAAAEPLAALMRAGYEDAFAASGIPADEAFLDLHCGADPSCFINIAMDNTAMYFYNVYDGGETPVLLCARVAFDALRDYTWEAIENAKHAETLPPPEEEIIPIELPSYDLSGAVPESEMVGDDYFDDALFIGNSLIVGLQRTVPLNARYFASVGLNISQVFTKEFIALTDGTNTTVSHALEFVEFNKVYLMFGVNELGWGSITTFIDYYAKLINRIREVNPNALVYVQSILPINEEKWAKSPDYQSCINNVSVATFNGKIIEMCLEKNAYFVNVAEVLTDETGNLYTEATSDGIHIGGVYSTRWVEYLKTHTVAME